jgi:O-antigen/teichoic acid export membrane protein
MGRLAGLASIGGRGVASIADQASTAAVGFLCSVFIGRFLGAESLGVYAITSVFVLLVSAAQGAIILEPMSVFGAKKPREEMSRYYGFLTALEGGAIGLFTMALALGAVAAFAAGLIERTLFLALLAGALYANFLCLQYFVRRQFYVQQQQYLATIQSMAYLGLVACAFAAMWWFGGSTIAEVYLVLSLCSLAVSLTRGKHLAKSARWPKKAQVKGYAGDHWSFGKWVLLGVPLGFMNYSGYFFIVGALLSTEAAGHLKAVDVLIAPFAQIAIGLTLMLLPMTARNIDRMSLPAQRRLAVRMALPLVALAALYAALVFVAGEYALGLLFPGNMATSLPLVGIMALLPIFQALPIPAGIILSALQQPHLRFISYGVAVLIASCVSIPMMLSHGLVGAAVGMLTSQILFAVLQWMCLFWLWRRMAARSVAVPQNPGEEPGSLPIHGGACAAIRP